ncbi:GNAT family N-acetyltransferase [Vibrio sp. D173a]|uniref:GNAT family N-acetyltransferase n=1 Tax=Vibrio sp. D173a TaxID=2836349 RepID=UPI002555E697|nr:GNAT family N-acetyltransferase [Vibrio sp. D173a]MDK9757888.1 GNAT family N-acetyltransferase [Vibrio sp. D173a]
MEFIPVDLSRHLGLCIAFRKDAYQVSFGHQNVFDTQEITSWFTSIAEDPQAGFFHVIKDNQIVGQLECRYPVLDEEGRKFGYINLFYLLPEFRNQGLGRQLQDFLLKLFVNHGCGYARLRYIPGNDAGERFYYKNGWRPVGAPGDRGQLMQIDLLEYI